MTEAESRPKIDATFGGKMRITRSAERATVLFLPLCRPNASFLLFCLKFASIFSFSISETREKEIHPFQSGAGSALINQTES